MIYTKARERMERMLALRASGFTSSQIAERLGMREPSVRVALCRKRKQMARMAMDQAASIGHSAAAAPNRGNEK